MLNALKKLFGLKKAEVEAAPEVPYKVEVAPTPVAEKAAEAVIASIPAKKAPAKKATTGSKPRGRKPKAQK